MRTQDGNNPTGVTRSALTRRGFLATAAAGAVVATADGVTAPTTASATTEAGAGTGTESGAAGTTGPPPDTTHTTRLTDDEPRPPRGGPTGPTPAAPTYRSLTPFRDPLRIPGTVGKTRADRVSYATVRMRATTTRMHSQLPSTPVWAYDGQVTGPTFEVRRGEKLRVTWANELSGDLPVTVVEVPNGTTTPALWDQPGRGGVAAREDVAALRPWTVVHLHGALTGGGNDGWPENGVQPATSQLSEYPNEQRATALFYHDHAMGITRWNVMAGLSGMYLVRDEEEDALGLPGGAYEIPLMLADRNLETDNEGRLTGRLLHKTIVVHSEPLVQMRAFTGPFTTVNGVIWPYLRVEPRWYRFRVVNGANTRQYRLTLTDENGQAVPSGSVYQIGTDHGLLTEPVPVDGADGLTLGSAERADLLIDFSAFRGRRLRLTNTNPNPDPGPWPQVMEFRVGERPVRDPFTLPRRLSDGSLDDDGTGTPAAPQHPTERLVVLTPMGPGQALCWEMEKTEAPSGELPADGIVQIKEDDGTLTTYRRAAADFHDPVRFFVRTRGWERWRFLHVAPSGWPHPMHIHATSFRVVSRESYDISGFTSFSMPDGGIGCGTTAPLRRTGAGTVPPSERGWKDTVRVGAGELVTVDGYFGDWAGKFVYHCHMLEHEDMGMMRQFAVLPGQIQDIGMSSGPHGMETMQ
ncbi:multicopper oxidase domain-containing protein [Streptomyces sp. NBC_01231]|nr:multicopper oxidase domain-containing protein [Streptomyces sp. NBC_01231]